MSEQAAILHTLAQRAIHEEGCILHQDVVRLAEEADTLLETHDRLQGHLSALREAAEPFLAFFSFMEAIIAADGDPPLEDRACLGQVMGAGGSCRLHAEHFRRLQQAIFASLTPKEEEEA